MASQFENTEQDVVVVAEEWGGYAVAALLAKAGKRVKLLKLPGVGNPLNSRFAFARGPSLYFGFEKGGLADALFTELAVSIPSLRQDRLYVRVSPSFQVVLPTHRLDLSSDRAELLDEFKREFGSHYAVIREFLADIDQREGDVYHAAGQIPSLEPTGLRDRLILSREKWAKRRIIKQYQSQAALGYVRGHIQDPEWEAFLSLQTLFAYQKPIEKASTLELLMLYGGLQRGAIRLVDGEERLCNRFINLVQKQRSEVVPADTSVLRIRPAGRKMAEATMAGGKTVRAPLVIVALPETALADPGPVQNDGLEEFWVAFEASSESIPDPMKNDLVLSWEEGQSPLKHNYLALRLSLPEEEGELEKGTRSLVAIALLTPEERQEDRLREIEASIEQRVRWLLPFSENKLRRIKSTRAPFATPLHSFMDADVLGSLRREEVGAGAYYRSSKTRSLVVLPTLSGGRVDHLLFAMTAIHLVGE